MGKCGQPRCIEEENRLAALRAKGVDTKKGDVTIVKTFIADVDVLIDDKGRRFVKKK